MQRIKLPKNKRITGLYLYCTKCRSHYANDSLINCSHDKLIYKAKVHIPKSKKACKTKNLTATNFEDAVIEYASFVKELKNNEFLNIVTKASDIPVMLTDCFANFMAYLDNQNVPEFKIKYRTKHARTAYERSIRYFIEALVGRGVNVDFLKFTDINETLIGFYHTFLTEQKGFRNKTYNNIMLNLKSFFKYMISNYYSAMPNPMADFKKREVVPIIDSISEEEFSQLLTVITPENGKLSRKNRNTNLYRPWLIDAFTLGLLTGGRREEVVTFKWSGIGLDTEGLPSYLTINHYKVNRAKGNLVTDREYKIKRVFITQQLREYLYALGYEKYKGLDQFILCPDEKSSRATIMDKITAAFPHFFKIINNGVPKHFKFLRKTWITMMYRLYPTEAHTITGHERQDIIHNHYIDQARLINDIQEIIKLRNGSP